jgi:hypothetical protein
MKDLVNNLTEQQVSELLYALCRSGKVIIPNYYTKSTINNMFKNCEEFDVNCIDMNALQLNCEGAELDQIVYDACIESFED